jgi:all-trans-retinol dehydrogenase (NAD+)
MVVTLLSGAVLGIVLFILILVIAFHVSVKLYKRSYDRRYQPRDIRGETVLITGGAGGIGRCLADRFAKLGANLIIWDVNDALLEKAKEELGAVTTVAVANVDVSDREAVNAAAAQAGEIDILVNNAGILYGKPFLELTDDQLVRIVNINQLGNYWTIRAFLPAMIRRKRGHLVCMSSQGGLTGAVNLADYSSTKHALKGLMESLHLEFRKQKVDIKITTVFPFYARTTLFDADALLGKEYPTLTPGFVADEMVDAVVRGIPHLSVPKILRWLPALRLLPYEKQLEVLERPVDSLAPHFK